MVVLAPLIAAVNATHQLTPVMLCVCLFALTLTRRYRNHGLLAVAVLLMLAWDLTMGRPLFVETLSTLEESLGELTRNSRAGYAGQLTGPGPELAGTANVLMVLAVAALAGTALVLRRRLVRSALPLLLVSAAPVPLFAVNDYGGEMLFRVYLFGLPGAAFFAAAALVPAAGTHPGRAKAPRRKAAAVALPAVLLVLTAGFLPSYYGKETMYYTPPEETALVTRVLDNAPDGSLILSTSGSFPQALHRYDRLEHWFFAEQELPENERMLEDPARYPRRRDPAGHQDVRRPHPHPGRLHRRRGPAARRRIRDAAHQALRLPALPDRREPFLRRRPGVPSDRPRIDHEVIEVTLKATRFRQVSP
ncbi:hypothetical protein GCM10023238_21370 [Streptomyces heliomycini]